MKFKKERKKRKKKMQDFPRAPFELINSMSVHGLLQTLMNSIYIRQSQYIYIYIELYPKFQQTR